MIYGCRKMIVVYMCRGNENMIYEQLKNDFNIFLFLYEHPTFINGLTTL